MATKRDRIRGCVREGRCWPGACFAVANAERANNKNERGKEADVSRGLRAGRSVDNERKDRRRERDLMSAVKKKRGGWKMTSPCCETGEGSANEAPNTDWRACRNKRTCHVHPATNRANHLATPVGALQTGATNACAMWRRIACSDVSVCLTLRGEHHGSAAAVDHHCRAAVQRVLADSCLTNKTIRQATFPKSNKSNERGPAFFLASGGLFL